MRGHKSNRMTRDMLAGTASFINCTGGVNGDQPTEITASDVLTVQAQLLGNDAYTIMDFIEAQDQFGTAPTRNSYVAMCHTDMTPDLQNTNGFVHNSQYPGNRGAILNVEWGAIYNLRFMVSSIGSKVPNASANGNTVYNIFVCGMESYCCIDQDQYSAEMVFLGKEFSGPLAQNVSIGYKFAEVPRITNDQWIINMRATLANP